MSEILLPYPPSLNRYLRHTGRTYRTEEANKYANMAGWIGNEAGLQLHDGPVSVQIILHPKAKKNGNASNTRIDLDNALKVAIDALQGVAYINDNQIEQINARYGAPLPGGGLSIAVSPMQD